MKKKLLSTAAAVLCVLLALTMIGCENTPAPEDPTPEPTPEATPKPVITADQVDVLTETWVTAELPIISAQKYKMGGEKPETVYKPIDVVFTNRETGRTMTIPAFWYESRKSNDNTFMVRFAPPEYGIWDYKIISEFDTDVNGRTGTVGANEYTGDLAIYQHGFVKTNGSKYFVYDDGTPFFYLGDTHWAMLREEFDSAGPHAGKIQTDSHFKYIVDKRVEQGFTVYQSEPIEAPFSVTDGFQKPDLKGFAKADGYYQYIAAKGLVHANACLVFDTLIGSLAKDDNALQALSRYWVARFGSYPVMWTLAQECDNDHYSERGDHTLYTYKNNPWVKVAEYMHACDAYSHPLSGHQEATSFTTVTGAGTTAANRNNNGASAFLSDEVTQKTGHDFWAAQWSANLTGQSDQAVLEDYWNSPKVGIDYEGRYCYLWTKDFGARAQGWVAYLSGLYGYGYGAADIWCYLSTYNAFEPSNDGIQLITPADKAKQWSEAVEFESAYQVGYMRQFLEGIEWWNLKPDFNNQTKFRPEGKCVYAAATINENETYVIYLYGKSTATGTVLGLDDKKSYTVKWFNPRSNEYGTILEKETSSSGELVLDRKPTTNDWVVLVTVNK